MPTLIRQEGFAIRIPTNDHEPPHVHCWRGAVEIIVNLDMSTTVREVNGPAKVGDQRDAKRIVAEHRQKLLDAWRLIHG